MCMDYYKKIEDYSREEDRKRKFHFGRVDRFYGVLVALLYAFLYNPAVSYTSFLNTIISGTAVETIVREAHLFNTLPYALAIGALGGVVYFLFGFGRLLMLLPIPVAILHFMTPFLILLL